MGVFPIASKHCQPGTWSGARCRDCSLGCPQGGRSVGRVCCVWKSEISCRFEEKLNDIYIYITYIVLLFCNHIIIVYHYIYIYYVIGFTHHHVGYPFSIFSCVRVSKRMVGNWYLKYCWWPSCGLGNPGIPSKKVCKDVGVRWVFDVNQQEPTVGAGFWLSVLLMEEILHHLKCIKPCK